jgi:hypothetical protein
MVEKDTGGYVVLDMRTGLMDGTYSFNEDRHDIGCCAQGALEYFAAAYPLGMWIVVKRVGYLGEQYPFIPDELWAFDHAEDYYGAPKV